MSAFQPNQTQFCNCLFIRYYTIIKDMQKCELFYSAFKVFIEF